MRVSYSIQLTLRLIHVFAGIFWAGSLLFFARLLGPALRATGGAGDKVSQDLILNRGIGKIIPITAGLTVLSGITMYIRFAMASHGAWPQSRTGIVFGIGGAAGLLALIAGATLIGPSLERVAPLSALGLIDEYRLYFRPIVLGGGKPFFAGARPPLRLVGAEPVGEDAVRLTYGVAT